MWTLVALFVLVAPREALVSIVIVVGLLLAGGVFFPDGNELPPRPKAGTGSKAVRAGFGPHGIAVTDTNPAYTGTVLAGGRECLTDWHVEVNNAIKDTRP
ncbi:hypothetical protein [Streptomyces sp. NPDC090445]|uniref:hypothetical protein n=1 Tax=Streptomyces sp. NPDC090445 TaxID=3365963 RepID=UPI003825A287